MRLQFETVKVQDLKAQAVQNSRPPAGGVDAKEVSKCNPGLQTSNQYTMAKTIVHLKRVAKSYSIENFVTCLRTTCASAYGYKYRAVGLSTLLVAANSRLSTATFHFMVQCEDQARQLQSSPIDKFL